MLCNRHRIEIYELYRSLPRLETQRHVLRKIAPDDLQDIFAYASDPEVTQHLRWGPHKTQSETRAYLDQVLLEYQTGQDGPWGMEYRDSGRIIGSIHLMAISAQHRKAEIGFVLARTYWNQRLATEALRRVLAYCFETVGLNRLEGLCLVENHAAKRVLEKVGMVREGLLRESLFQKGAFRNFELYAILRHDQATHREQHGPQFCAF
jgi:ribosomal-protein-alanine N-acetyltransferase